VLGVDWRAHDEPFQRMASVAAVGVPCQPTAVQAVPEEHETPCNSPPPDTAGVDCSDHDVPFQRSTIGVCVPPSSR
jgi:hypothetical protein